MEEYHELANLLIDNINITKDLTNIIKGYFYPIEVQKYNYDDRLIIYWRGKHTSGFYNGIKNKIWFNPQSAIIYGMENLNKINDYKVLEEEYYNYFYDDDSEHLGNMFILDYLEKILYSLLSSPIMKSDKIIDLLTFYYARETNENFLTQIDKFLKNNRNIPNKYYSFHLISDEHIQIFEKDEIVKELSMILSLTDHK